MSERTESQCILEAELRERFAGDPIARMVLGQHSLDETGQCEDCAATIEVHVSGYDYDIDPVIWPCDSVRYLVFAAAGWEAADVLEVEAWAHRLDGRTARAEDWVAADIPGHRASNYARLHIPLAEAQIIEARAAEDGTDLDASLPTMVALRASTSR